ncbi:M4 family metallopeptidase [Aequorivita antarctica]|uniref:T9SS type A sorting domain-containing protein n=1 Tax=Aequorivita antarctica TaxID=153266 RepID=A0A5C6Z634_9FLAO|nr:M4 family metallopeptidase [Aequorivita antarctica]TXD74892.1 T9SS type A sorting domain-containing protein [Aequorivita antarctica]SRX72383.1 Bacillolysin [Aequorivita antarctica]
MKKINKFVFLFSLLIFAFSAVVSAQNKNDEKKSVKQPPSLVVFDASQSYSLQNSTTIFKEVLNPSSQTSFTTLSQEQDPLGFTHQKMQQYFNGVKVEFATVTLSSKNGTVQTLSSAYFPIADDFNVTSSISNSQALNSAIAHVGASKYMWQNAAEAALADNYKKPTGELVIIPAIENITETNRLAYKFDIYATAPLYRADVYIDAKTGQFIMENKRIHDANVPATGTSLYNGNVSFTADNASGPYRLRQTADGGGIQTFDLNNSTNYNNAVDVTSSSTNFTSNPTGVQAHFGAEKTYKYFSQNYGRNSYNNTGGVIKSYVSYSSNYVNAFWDGSRMTYGDGDGTNYGPLVSLDICGHEITHGVTEYSANLVYSYQSGALNESFSDIFGESIEKFASGTNDWLMGDDIGAGGSGGALRSMSNPNAYGDPDTYQGTNWYSGSADSGGVHTNSGVQNFWYYVLSVGKSGTNDKGDSYNVTGIGMDKAGAIAYRNLTVYLNSNSQYSDARNGAIQAARDLYGVDSAEEIATTNAWYAVGVGAAYGGGGGGSNYCASQGNNVNDEYISRVQLNTINNASGAQLYSDFTSISTSLNEGSAYTVIVTPTWTGTVYNEGYAVWIDYNGDGDFGDAGELVWSKAASKNTPNSGTFTVPSGTVGGETRMRVSMKYNGIPTSCETFSYGEVEDYTINLGGAGPDTQAPTAPSSLVASSIAQTTLTLSWNASTDNVGVTGYDVFQGSTNLGSVTGTSANITGLTPSTAYSFKVRAHDAAGNNSGYSNTVNVTTLSNTITYCSSQGNNTNDEYIDRVQLGSINNLSGNNGGYANFTSISTALAKGSSNTITITPKWTGSKYSEAYRVWIDYNQDGDFDDSGEQVYSRSRTTASPISGSFTVPTSALSGATRMRVTMKYNANPSPCETFTYGEVEDYTVTISNSVNQGITGDTGFNNSDMSIYPNPAKHTLNISLVDATGKDYVIYNVMGQVVSKGSFTESLNVSSLQSGVYMLEVNSDNNKLMKRFVKE